MKVTDEQLAAILRLKEEGLTAKTIAARFGISPNTVSDHVRKAKRTPQDDEEYRNKRNERRRAARAAERSQYVYVAPDGVGTAGPRISERPPDWVIAERDRRLSRSYSIAVDFLGDPEGGRSALDKKRAEVPA